MQHRFRPVARACAGAVVLAFLSACGGGGGGGSTPSTPATAAPVTSTPGPGTLNVPGEQSSGGGAGGFVNDGTKLSSYTVTSNPSGKTFTLAGQSYTTPANVSPPVSPTSPLALVFTSGYSVPIVQVLDGAHTVFYNAASDSKGTVAVSSLQSLRRGVADSVRRTGTIKAHPLVRHAATFNNIDSTRVAVRMSAAALRTSGRSPADVERATGAVGRETVSATTDRLRVVSVPDGVSVADFTRKLQAQPEVAEVTAVHRRHVLSRPPTVVTDPGVVDYQWYTAATGTNYAWSYNPGSGTKIAIIDSGIDENNTDLTAQLKYQESAITPIDGSTCQPVSGATTQVSTAPSTIQDDLGHGTNTAGIALAKANTVGSAGAAWGAQLLVFKIFPPQTAQCNEAFASLGATIPDEARAIDDAVKQGADVINMSFGSAGFDTVEFNAVESAINAGVTVVAAAGNDNLITIGTLDYPGAYPGVISVGASALKDEFYGQDQSNTGTYASSTEVVAAYSQYAPSLSVVAPGGYVCDACNNDQDVLHWVENYETSTNFDSSLQCSTTSPATSCLGLFEGTSQATPQVSATAAMLIAEAGGHLTPSQVKYLIESTADNINDPHQGHGRLNAYRALASLIRDTSAYTGPAVQKAGTAQLVAFAYNASRTNKPKILDATFPAGVPVAADGSFRIADVPPATGAFHVAVWYDGNGDGVIDVGDQIGVSAAACSSTAVCAIGSIALHAAAAGYFLP